jgi:thioredoxin reductase (NADPH)
LSGVLDAIVAGGGPAGLAAGFYLSRAGFKTLLLERDRLGGQARRIHRIFNYPGFPGGITGAGLTARIERQARSYGLAFERARVLRVESRKGGLAVVTEAGILGCRAAVIATGADFLDLGVPGERALRGRGLWHAPFESAPDFRGMTVAVVGGGEAAAHQALRLARWAGKVHLICRGPALKAVAPLREAIAKARRVEFLAGTRVTALLGGRRLRAAEIEDASGRRELPLEALFVLVGKRPGLPGLRLAPGAKGVFVAGDAREGCFRQAAIAAADGMARAMECELFLRENRNA